MNELRLGYKRETGDRPNTTETDYEDLFSEDYVEWLESKITELSNIIVTIENNHNYKDDFEDAEREIGQLQDQLDDAMDEIRELNRNQ